MHAGVGIQVWFPELELLCVIKKKKKKKICGYTISQVPVSICMWGHVQKQQIRGCLCWSWLKNINTQAAPKQELLPTKLWNIGGKYMKIKTGNRTAIYTWERLQVPKSNRGSNTSINVGQLHQAILKGCFSPCFFNPSVCSDDQHQILLRSLQACKIIWFHNDYIFTLQLAEVFTSPFVIDDCVQLND